MADILGGQADDELAAAIQHRAELVAQVVARHQEGDAPVEMRGVCEYSGWCGCRCRDCLGGRHPHPHKRDCHVGCRGL